MNRISRHFTILLFVFMSMHAFSQRAVIDSLSHVLDERQQFDSTTAAITLDLAYAYSQVNPDSTYLLASRSLEYARENNLRSLEAWALNRISNSFWLRAKFPQALEAAQEALDIFQDINNQEGVADSYNVLASTHAMDNDLQRGLYYYKLSVEAFDVIGDENAYSRGISNIGRVYYMMNEYDSALLYMDKVRRIVDGQRNIRESIMYNTTGDILQQKGELVVAARNYFKGLEIAEEIRIPRIITYSTRGLAEVYQMQGDIAESNEYALRTYDISKDIGYLENVRNASRILSDNFREEGNFEKAYEYFAEYSATRDSMFNIQKEREIQKLEENFEISQKQKEIELLTAQSKIQEQKSNQQQLMLYGLIIIIALALLAAFFQYRKNVLEQKTNRLLTFQKTQLEQQNTDILKQRKEIEKQSKLLEEVNDSKDKLFSIISHDLKSPFGALLLVTEHLDQKTFSQEELTSLKTDLHGKVKSLNEMLNNLLYWSKSQMQGSKTDSDDFDIAEMIRKNVEIFSQVAGEKQIKIKAEIEPGLMAYADSNQIDCVIRNLVNNAIKFTAEGGEIKIKGHQVNGKIEVAISDSGIGIPEENLSRLFNAGEDIHTKGTRNETGSGLGLFLSKEFVENNGGEISVDSTVGKGSTFLFTLPGKRN